MPKPPGHSPCDARKAPARPAGALAAALLTVALGFLWPPPGALQPPAEGGAPAGAPPPAALRGPEPISPLPAPADLDPAKVALGERLFRDPRLSHGGTVACATCHRLDRDGADGRGRPIGADGRPLDFNAPTVFNAALSFRLNWRGNYRTLEEQAEAVLHDPALMGTSWGELLGRLRGDQGYRDAFARIYGGEPEAWQVLDALAGFQRSLLTPGARFDRWLSGERDALTPDEEAGYALFKSYGCIACHQGVNVGGNLFQRFGVFAARPVTSASDLGRYGITGAERDRRVFRVPSLRNVAVTAPYFHDGAEPSLAGAVRTMALSQLGRSMSAEEIDLVVRFLGTLTGEYDGRPVTASRIMPP